MMIRITNGESTKAGFISWRRLATELFADGKELVPGESITHFDVGESGINYFVAPTARSEAGFADAYEAARRRLPREMMLEVVSRNADDDKMQKLYRPDNESDDELVRRIVATYLALTTGSQRK